MHWQVLAALAGVVCLVWLYRRDRSRLKAARASVFSECLDLFQSYRVTQDDLAYPVLQGKYRGRDVRLEPIVDHMAWRKLPVLWLKVTVLQAIPYRGVLDLLMRPASAEFYSPSGHLDHRLKLPADWPQEAILCTDDPEALPSLDLIAPHMHLFENRKLKELVVTPLGVRLVARISEASRGRYAVFREIRFDGDRTDCGFVRELLDATIAIADSLSPAKPLLRVA